MIKNITTLLLIVAAISVQAQNKPTKKQTFNFNTVTGTSWDEEYKTEYAYLKNGDSIVEDRKRYNHSTFKWENEEVKTSIYNSNNGKFYKSNSNIWTNGKYNNDEMIVSINSYLFLGGQSYVLPNKEITFKWNELKLAYDTVSIKTYDVNKFERRVYGYVKTKKWKGTWVNEERFIYVYDGYRIESNEHQVWVGNAWEKRDIEFYDYLAGTKYNQIIYRIYNKITAKYDQLKINKYQYNSTTHLLDSIVSYSYDKGIKDYKESAYIAYKYNKNGELIEELFSSGPKSGTSAYYKIVYTYSTPSSIKDIKTNANLAYPNPVSQTLKFTTKDKWVSGKLFDLMGQTIKSYTAEDFTTNTLDMTMLPNDTYLILLENSEGNTFTQKIIVKH